MLCLSGRHFYGYRGRIWKVDPGTVILIDQGDPHDDSYAPHQPECRDLWIHFHSPSYFTMNEVNISAGRTKRLERQTFYSITHSKPFAETATFAWNHCAENPGSAAHIAQLKSAVTALLFEILLYNTTMSNSERTVAQQERVVDEIKTYVCGHLSEDLSLSALAGMAGYDPAYLHRLFARFAGEPIHQYINRHRVQKAKDLLASGQKATSIASELGFSSHSYFCRFFKRETQLSPTEWAESKKNRPPASDRTRNA